MSDNPLTRLLGVEHPIVLAPFGGLSSVELTATVSELGGLGSYGLYGYEPDRILETVAALRAATSRPFAVNLWLPTGDEVTPADGGLDATIAVVAPFFAELGAPVPEPPAAYLPDFAAQAEAVLEARPAALSFVFGVPPAGVVDAARERGIRIVGTATTVEEALALEA
ncbi:MAG TPA: nitronate monooxygenase, partial [Solirubrobacteraceae bacterium]|nr:nitronate monooxygenase [Solirubrobacteraceae bacterium]